MKYAYLFHARLTIEYAGADIDENRLTTHIDIFIYRPVGSIVLLKNSLRAIWPNIHRDLIANWLPGVTFGLRCFRWESSQ